MSKVSGVLGRIVHRNRAYPDSRDLHDGGVDRPVVDQPTKARSVFFLGGIGELLRECSESLTGEISHAVRYPVCRVHNRRHKALTPPLQHLEVCITIDPLVSIERRGRKDGRTADVLCASVRIVQCLVER